MRLVLREYLQERDITLAKLCRMTNTCYKTLNMWVTKKPQYINMDIVDKICYALNCKLSDILVLEKPEDADNIKRSIQG